MRVDDFNEVPARSALAGAGVRPKSILWDGRLQVEDTDSSKGSYVGFPDRSGAVFFGVHRSGVWVPDREGDPDSRTLLERPQDDQHKALDVKKQEAALERVHAVWNGARPARGDHPYLSSLGLGSLSQHKHGLRVSRATDCEDVSIPAGLLVVPHYCGNQLANVQLIAADGAKRFLPDAQVWGGHVVAGGGFDTQRIYVCVDWATAWTIFEATGHPAVAALFVGGMKPVARSIREMWPHLEIVVATDNDRWSTVEQSTERADIPNPGVHFGQEAADAVGARVAIPDFESLDGKPTTFAHLQLREGAKMVRAWLDPDLACEARTVEDQQEVPAQWVEHARLRCLGYRDGKFCYLDANGELICLTAAAHTARNLLRLDPHPEWWKKEVGAALEDRVAALIQEHHRVGVFAAQQQVRGLGAWCDEEDEAFLHLGDRLLFRKRVRIPEHRRYLRPGRLLDSGFVCPQLSALPPPDVENPMSVAESKEVLRTLPQSSWWGRTKSLESFWRVSAR